MQIGVQARTVRFLGAILTAIAVWGSPTRAPAQRQMESLGRGLVATRISSTQIYVGWRMLGTDPDDIGFNLYRSGDGGTAVKLNGAPLTVTTDYVDAPPQLNVPNAYDVRPVIDAVEQAPSSSFTVPAGQPVPTDHQGNPAPYLNIPLQIPPGGTSPDSVSYTYSANDCSIGDLDGDGEYEIVLKWDPSNSHDNAHEGYTGNVFLDAYEMDGTRLWRIDLGINIRAGAHYTQFMVYDLDGDGRAEVACKTAPGTVDGVGTDVILSGDNPATDYRNSVGRILTGPEYLTVFDGLTGAELATTDYAPPRGNVSSWGDNYGNRVDRFLAGVAYLDGIRPSLVMCRGYYTRTVLAAWDWRNGQLTQRWVFDTGSSGGPYSDYKGQGNHQLSVGDVDGDGKDEIVYGACSIDDDGSGLYTTGFNHGDALHVSDMDPDRPGIEVWDVHESGPTVARGGEFRDGSTGALIYGVSATDDVGRGLAAHIDGGYVGYQMWSTRTGGVLDRNGSQISGATPSINFVVWWDADLQRELLDNAGGGGADSKLDKWTGNGVTRILSPYSVDAGGRHNNSTKSNPCLSGDLLGDWREEMLIRSTDSSHLMLFVTPHPATSRLRTFLHDPQYRVALAWQNVAYNQPPHPGFYVGAGMSPPPLPQISDADRVWVGDGISNVWDVGTTVNWRTGGVWNADAPATYENQHRVLFDLSGINTPVVSLQGQLDPAEVTVHSPTDYTFAGPGSLTGTMALRKAGTGTLVLNNDNTFSGPTLVTEGAVLVHGSLDQSPVTVRRGVWLNSAIGGSGTLGQGATVESGCGVYPGNGPGSAGTLTISNNLTETGGAANYFDLSEDPARPDNDLIDVVGDLSLSGINTIHINLLQGSLACGLYPLFQYSGTLNGSLANLNVADLIGHTLSLVEEPGRILLQVSEATDVQPVSYVDMDSVWRFRDDAVDLGTAWRTNDYNDTGWSSGPPELGFGDGDETTPVADNDQWTTYFRHEFFVPSASFVDTLTARLKRDDGAVVYLNGVEVWRSNMPLTGTITYTTPTPAPTTGGAESTWHTNALHSAALVDGWNLLAVEVHQYSATSTDVSFHLELDGTILILDPPQLSLQIDGGTAILSWSACAGAFDLFGTTNLTLPEAWQPIPDAPMITNGNWVVAVPATNSPDWHFRLQGP